jgi:predicted metal-dependent hydrolase
MKSAADQSATQSSTPDEVSIKPRNHTHDIAAALEDDGMDNSAFLTAFFKAFYTVGFNPWQQDTRDLLDQWAAEPELMSY